MSLESDVYAEFLGNLETEKDFPAAVIDQLRSLLSRGGIVSKDQILDAIEKGEGAETDGNDQGN